jgi:hypothetical protein
MHSRRWVGRNRGNNLKSVFNIPKYVKDVKQDGEKDILRLVLCSLTLTHNLIVGVSITFHEP